MDTAKFQQVWKGARPSCSMRQSRKRAVWSSSMARLSKVAADLKSREDNRKAEMRHTSCKGNVLPS
eukprot:1963194-Amphidinium_carterae.1